MRRPAGWLAAHGVSADAVTLSGFFIGLLAIPLLAAHAYGLSLVCISANRVLDGIDGAIARRLGPTDRGAFIDIASDFFFYAAIPFGFALADPTENALAASALLVSFVGTGSSFLAAAVIAQKRGISAVAYPQKGIYYLGGLTEGTETIVVFFAMCMWPTAFAMLAWIFATFALATTVARWWWAWRLFSQTPPASASPG